jgi:hypothetical protein
MVGRTWSCEANSSANAACSRKIKQRDDQGILDEHRPPLRTAAQEDPYLRDVAHRLLLLHEHPFSLRAQGRIDESRVVSNSFSGILSLSSAR